jgi:hypothetical protein
MVTFQAARATVKSGVFPPAPTTNTKVRSFRFTSESQPRRQKTKTRSSLTLSTEATL